MMSLLATQFENERPDKDFDSNIRILLHAQAIKSIAQNRTFNLRAHLQKMMMRAQNPEAGTLPVTEVDMMKLEDKLLEYAEHTKQPVTLTLPVRSKETCWNSILTPDQKKQEIFTGKCGECQVLHEHPKCEKCKSPREQHGQYSNCLHTNSNLQPTTADASGIGAKSIQTKSACTVCSSSVFMDIFKTISIPDTLYRSSYEQETRTSEKRRLGILPFRETIS